MRSVWGWVKCRQEEGRNAEPWYFKARHWHKSPRRRQGSSSSQGRVGRAMGQPLPGLACWYLQMPSLKCWRSLLLLKRSPERLGSCPRAEGTQKGGPFGQTPQLHASASVAFKHTNPPVHSRLFPKLVPQLLELPNREIIQAACDKCLSLGLFMQRTWLQHCEHWL